MIKHRPKSTSMSASACYHQSRNELAENKTFRAELNYFRLARYSGVTVTLSRSLPDIPSLSECQWRVGGRMSLYVTKSPITAAHWTGC
jgi:hypothetical protein